MITGEAKPTKGEVEKHPNLRIAYIAQHAFHHLESHITETPVQYIMRRYEHGEDEEEAEKVGPPRRSCDIAPAQIENLTLVDGTRAESLGQIP